MKTITDINFPEEFKTQAEEYISYKRSLGFKFPMDDQRRLLYMLNHVYMGHKGIESTEYYLRLTKQYFVNVLNYTQEQADTIFPEV